MRCRIRLLRAVESQETSSPNLADAGAAAFDLFSGRISEPATSSFVGGTGVLRRGFGAGLWVARIFFKFLLKSYQCRLCACPPLIGDSIGVGSCTRHWWTPYQWPSVSVVRKTQH